jgi:glycerol-3-phosphate acyltransferase PlsY
MILAALLVLAYLAGSVQAAVIVSRWAGAPDPRSDHSGNPGATNVYRTAGPGWAALVLLLDVGRAALVGWLARSWVPAALVPAVCVALLLGTFLPLFHGFRGGKGVASLLGFVLGAGAHAAVGLALAAWVAGRLVTGQAFLGSFPMVAVLAAGLGLESGGFWGWAGSFLAGSAVIWRHRANLARYRFESRRPGGPLG